jgi:ribonuclease Z
MMQLMDWAAIDVSQASSPGAEFELLHRKSTLKLGSITKIFITHMHGDHTYGLVPLMLAFPEAPPDEPANDHVLDIYGPKGLRQLVRWTLKLSYARPARKFRVHEILFDHDPSSLHEPAVMGELVGSRDIATLPDGTWLVEKEGPITIRAAPIQHTVPCVGYVIDEDPSPASIGPTQLDALKRNSRALIASGISQPVTLLGELQRTRQPIALPDGTFLQPPPLNRPGVSLSVVVAGNI